MHFPPKHIRIQEISNQLTREKGISWLLARFDEVHPVASGNKLFKLHYFLQLAKDSGRKKIVTYGGAFSNHLVATALACREAGLASEGIVRGEEPEKWSHTLSHCRSLGMALRFVPREAFRAMTNPNQAIDLLADNEHLLIPEGGFHPLGAKGAAMMMDYLPVSADAYIGLAVGTATTLAGILSASTEEQTVLAIPVLKGMSDIDNRLHLLLGDHVKKPVVLRGHDRNGYARYDADLISFMNQLYAEQQVATDFVYTGKMMMAIAERIQQDFFPRGSQVICLHTGGLQGNLSLEEGSLVF